MQTLKPLQELKRIYEHNDLSRKQYNIGTEAITILMAEGFTEYDMQVNGKLIDIRCKTETVNFKATIGLLEPTRNRFSMQFMDDLCDPIKGLRDVDTIDNLKRMIATYKAIIASKTKID